MSWTWIISTGEMLKPDGSLLESGYSGHAYGINNPNCISIPNIGPIPCGPNNTDAEYTIGPLLPNAEQGPLHHLGPNVANLIPSAMQRAFIASLERGPDSFYCHGGVAGEPQTVEPGKPVPTGSEGCIVLPFAARMQILESEDRVLVVKSGVANA